MLLRSNYGLKICFSVPKTVKYGLNTVNYAIKTKILSKKYDFMY